MTSIPLMTMSRDLRKFSSILRPVITTTPLRVPAIALNRFAHTKIPHRTPLVSQVRSKSATASPAVADPIVGEDIVLGENSLTVTGHEGVLNYIWLRENCRCPVCYNHDIFQKNLHPHHIQPDIRPESAFLKDGELHLVWPDGHESSLPMTWVGENSYPPKTQDKVERYYWDNTMLSLDDIPQVAFEDFMESDEAKKTVLRSVLRYGFGMVHGIPPEIEDTRRCVQRICHVEHTIFGDIFAVAQEKTPDDYSYMTGALLAHTDTTYRSAPMGMQVLHAVYNDCEGGESLLLDGFHVAERLRAKMPEGFDLLANTPVPQHYKKERGNANHFYSFETILKVEPVTKELYWIRYNPYAREPLNTVPPEKQPELYAALSELSRLVEDPKQELWFKLPPGSAMFMDNYRLLHGRSGFVGRRKLHGCYLPHDDWISKARIMGLL